MFIKKINNMKKANTYFLKAYQINVARKNKAEILNSLSKLAGNLFMLDTVEARKKYLEVCKLATEIGSKVEALYANLN
jgi:cell division protein FtsB